ncbi:hypothetical protein NL676_004217 [Syzygium grande]|nr:hypothetical protein NL676_004217 [Syzygium grande]
MGCGRCRMKSDADGTWNGDHIASAMVAVNGGDHRRDDIPAATTVVVVFASVSIANGFVATKIHREWGSGQSRKEPPSTLPREFDHRSVVTIIRW